MLSSVIDSMLSAGEERLIQDKNHADSLKNVKISGTIAYSFAETHELETQNDKWYTDRDLLKLNRCNKYIIVTLRRAQNKNINLSDEEYCLRGLEEKVSIRACQQRKANIVKVIQSVLDEQQRQREVDASNPISIALISEHHSYNSKCKALQRGVDDANEALKYILPQKHGIYRPFLPLRHKLDNESPRSTTDLTIELLSEAIAIMKTEVDH